MRNFCSKVNQKLPELEKQLLEEDKGSREDFF